MNFIDVLIILAVIGSFVRGYHIGLARQAGSTIGFLVGLVIGSWASNLIVSVSSNPVSRSLISLVIVLMGGFIFMTLGEVAGIKLKEKLARSHSLNKFDGGLGSVMAAATVLFAFWLGASILVLGPTSGLQQ